MPSRIEVTSDAINAEGNSVKDKVVRDLEIPVDEVKVTDVYIFDGEIEKPELEKLGSELFADPITQRFSVDKPLAKDFDWLIQVGYKPGVTDNVGRTSSQATASLIGRSVDVYTEKQYLLRGNLTLDQVRRVANELLANNLIQRVGVIPHGEWDPDKVDTYIPKVTLQHKPEINLVNLDVSDDDLLRLSKENVLALNLEEMKSIQSYFRRLGRPPTDAELESLAQTWSEHCYHKIFRGEIDYRSDDGNMKIDSLFKTFIQDATQKIRRRLGKRDWLTSVFTDNAGIVKLDGDFCLAVKVETHNSPSALDPYGGAITGIVGVNRDIIGAGLGSKPIANTDVFCFAHPNYKGSLPERIRHPRRVFEGVRKGVEHGGNKSGIPTINGTVRFDSYSFGSVVVDGVIQSYMGKPLVFCGTVGIMPSHANGKDISYKKANPDDLIVMAGGRIGKDGIHGATFSSESLHEGSPATAVQIGDPITQKKMIDMLLEARDLGLYTSITDNGAGGLSCSVGEMARESGGAELNLGDAPLKYAGLNPWEILLSEAQERMTISVPPKKIGEFLGLAKKHDVEATVLGRYTKSGRFHVVYEDKEVADLDLVFLHEGVPKRRMTARWKPPVHEEPHFKQPDLDWALKTG